MCRNITELRGLRPAATAEEIEAAARQYVRKISGLTKVPAGTVEVFEAGGRRGRRVDGTVFARTARAPHANPNLPPLRRPSVIARRAAKATVARHSQRRR